jgi:hypothetical protein
VVDAEKVAATDVARAAAAGDMATSARAGGFGGGSAAVRPMTD